MRRPTPTSPASRCAARRARAAWRPRRAPRSTASCGAIRPTTCARTSPAGCRWRSTACATWRTTRTTARAPATRRSGPAGPTRRTSTAARRRPSRTAATSAAARAGSGFHYTGKLRQVLPTGFGEPRDSGEEYYLRWAASSTAFAYLAPGDVVFELGRKPGRSYGPHTVPWSFIEVRSGRWPPAGTRGFCLEDAFLPANKRLLAPHLRREVSPAAAVHDREQPAQQHRRAQIPHLGAHQLVAHQVQQHPGHEQHRLMCRTEVESTYSSRSDETGCVNPEFGELPVGEPDVPGLRADQDRLKSSRPAEQRARRGGGAPCARQASTGRGAPRAARRARGRRPRRSRSSGRRRRGRAAGHGSAGRAQGRDASSAGASASRSWPCGSSPRGALQLRDLAGERRDLLLRLLGLRLGLPVGEAGLQALDLARGRVDLGLEILDRDVLADDRAERRQPRDRPAGRAPSGSAARSSRSRSGRRR